MQRAVLTQSELFQHTALAAHLREHTCARQSFILCVLQFFGQIIYLNEILLAAVSVGYIYHNKKRNEQEHPYLSSYRLRVEDITTEYFSQSKTA